MRQKLITLSFIVCILLSCTTTVFAKELDLERKGSISVTLADPEDSTPIVGAKLAVYRIETIEGEESESLVANGSTDVEGKVVFSDLPLGLYLVKQDGTVEGYAPCKPFYVSVPIEHDGDYVYDVDASPKTEIIKLTSIAIKKVWNTGKSTKIVDSVTVQLLREDSVVETVTLSDENNWMVTLENIPISDSYRIQEVNVPKGFTATYLQNGYEFTVTNTASLAQTGQLVWPIPVLAISGLFFLFTGVIILHKTRRKDA